MAPHYQFTVGPGEERVVRMRLTNKTLTGEAFGDEFDLIFEDRIREANEFYRELTPTTLGPQQDLISRQGYAGKECSCDCVFN